MANGRVHRLAGALSGAGSAALRAKDLPGQNQLVEAIGGAIGGYWGGQLPDLLEPATSSWHRDFAHSVSVGGLAVKATNMVAEWESDCRRRSKHFGSLRQATHDQRLVLWYRCLELFWLLVAGVVIGFLTGYISHLVLDALTPRGLPLVARQIV